MLLQADKSCLLVIDVQEKLLPAVQTPESIVTHCRWLIQLAEALTIPVLVSEQYRQGLGPTVPALQTLLSDSVTMEKTHFSCVASPACKQHIEAVNRLQVVIAGIEAHVCVLQTALELSMAGKMVFVVVEAVSSRRPEDKELALLRMRDAGVQLVSREMVFFEWLKQADTALFRQLRKQFIQ